MDQPRTCARYFLHKTPIFLLWRNIWSIKNVVSNIRESFVIQSHVDNKGWKITSYAISRASITRITILLVTLRFFFVKTASYTYKYRIRLLYNIRSYDIRMYALDRNEKSRLNLSLIFQINNWPLELESLHVLCNSKDIDLRAKLVRLVSNIKPLLFVEKVKSPQSRRIF